MKKLFTLVIALVMIAGQLTGLSALAENASNAADHIPFHAEEGLSADEYDRKKSEFGEQVTSARSAVPATISLRSSVNKNTLSNDYIEFAVDSTSGRFTVGTVEGNPALSTDDNKIMLFGHNNPWSSFTTVRVNGESYIYGDSGFRVSPHFDGDANYSEAVFGNIRVQQVIGIVENSATHRDDIVEIKYIVTNTGSSAASLGLRIMMDTMLGTNDAAPFRIPGHGDLTTEKEFVGEDIPQYWQAFDSLNSPKVVSHGNFISGAIRPNKVQFTNWSRVYNTPWGYRVSEGKSNGDSAVSIIWERTLAAGAQETYVTSYGLSELVQDLQPPLGVTIAAGSSILANEKSDGYLPYPITIYIQNIGTATAKNVKCTIDLPDELIFADTNTSRTVYQKESLEVGSVITIEKTVYVKERLKQDKNTQFRVSVTADNTETKTLTKQLTISAVQTISGQFKYPGMINEKTDSTATYFYSDRYFDGDAAVYNPQLATMSLCLELSAWPSYDVDDWPDKTKNAYALLNDIEFDCIEQNSAWNQKPSMHSVGVIAAHKKIGNSTVIALAIRGGGYLEEWGGNFVLGKSGDHEGFERARDEAYRFLDSYIRKHKIQKECEFQDELKVWIVGFSRGGAVTNLLAGKLTDELSCGGMDLPKKNIFAYTFEAPQGFVGPQTDEEKVALSELYKNIHNQVNSMDIVPLVAPSTEGFGFTRYNTNSTPIFPTLSIKSFENKVEAIQEQLKKVCEGIPKDSKNRDATYNPNPYAMYVDDIKVSIDGLRYNFVFGLYPSINIDIQWSRNKDLSVDVMLQNNINSVFSQIPGKRIGYANNMEHALSNLLRFILGNNKIDWFAVINDAFFSNLAEGMREIVGILLNPSLSKIQKTENAVAATIQHIVNVLPDGANSALMQMGTNLTEFTNTLSIVLKALFNTFDNNPQEFIGFLYYIACDNGIQPHFPEISLAAMMANDYNYTSGNATILPHSIPQSYRIVHVHCPVDVTVYDENQQILSRITGETVSNTSQVHGASIIEGGTKQVILPSDAAYTIHIDATGDGEMSVSVLEYNNVLHQYTLLHGWQNLSISAGDHFVADIPAYEMEDYLDPEGNGSATAYKLTTDKGRAIEPNLHLTGNDIEYHQVTLSSNNQKGIVMGGGQFVTSSFAQVQAAAMPTVEFLGWYLNGVCVSTDAVYRFAVNEDVNLVAHFSEGDFNKLTVTATAGGKVNISEMELPETVEIQLIAEPDSGFAFDHWEVTAGNIENTQSASTVFTMPASDAAVTAVFRNASALTIQRQPVDQNVVVGQKATFSIGASGDGITYQWYINRNNEDGWKKIDGAVAAVYTTSTTDLTCDGFRYYCTVSDQYGNTVNSDEAVLHVTPAPELPETGDSSAPALWLAMILLSILGLLLMRKKVYSK